MQKKKSNAIKRAARSPTTVKTPATAPLLLKKELLWLEESFSLGFIGVTPLVAEASAAVGDVDAVVNEVDSVDGVLPRVIVRVF